MFRNNLVYRFATKAYDLAVIGGGPGGTHHPLSQDTLLPSRVHNLDSIPSASKKEALSEEPVSTLVVSPQKPFSTSHTSIMNSTTTSPKWVSYQETALSTGLKSNKTKTVSSLPLPRVLKVSSRRTKSPT